MKDNSINAKKQMNSKNYYLVFVFSMLLFKTAENLDQLDGILHMNLQMKI